MSTNYDDLKNEKMKDPEFRAMYYFAKEKLELELMIDSIKEGVTLNKSPKALMRRINRLSQHIQRINLA